MREIGKIAEKSIPIVYKRSARARKLRISVHSDGRAVVTLPLRVSESAARKFFMDSLPWVRRQVARFGKFKALPEGSGTKRQYVAHRESARALAKQKLEHYARLHGFAYSGFTIRNQSSRWGSCSKKGRISLNYRIALLPEPLADYIVVHELCHLKHFNHSHMFWNLVESIMPDYKARRKELKLYRFSY